MAALSVQNLKGGKRTGIFPADLPIFSRNRVLAATPPASIIDLAPNSCAALIVLVTKQSAAASWNS